MGNTRISLSDVSAAARVRAAAPGGGERSPLLRRRPSREQGRSLEVLGHAIEYLVDSELRYGRQVPSRDTADATKILIARSREVFGECAEVVPVGRRIGRRLLNVFGRGPLQVAAHPERQL